MTTTKCPTHELEQPCRGCRADDLIAGVEQPGHRARISVYRPEPDAVPMPAYVRVALERIKP